MHYDIGTLELDNHHRHIDSPPPPLRATLIALPIQDHGTDLFIGQAHEILGSNDRDMIHAQVDSILYISTNQMESK